MTKNPAFSPFHLECPYNQDTLHAKKPCFTFPVCSDAEAAPWHSHSTMFRMPSNADSLSPVLLLEFILWVPSFLTPVQPSQGAECQTTVPSAKPCLGNPDPKRFVLSGEWSLKATGVFVLSLTGQVNIWTDKPEGWSTGIFRPPILLKKNWMKVT